MARDDLFAKFCVFILKERRVGDSRGQILFQGTLYGYLQEDNMGNSNAVTASTNLQKAVSWISDIVLDNPGKDRQVIIKEAQVRFDLTPAESTFLTEKFSTDDSSAKP